MNKFSENTINILDFPDEILCTIFNKLNVVDIFYSLVDVNERFNRLALPSMDIHHLDFVVKPLVKHYSSSIDDQVLNKICEKILSRICNDVNKLTVEPLSLERVLGIADYSHLNSISLVNFPAETLLSQLTGDTILVRLLTNQIKQLSIDNYVNADKSFDKIQFEIFSMIISVSKQLCDLTFRQYILKNDTITSILNSTRRCTSSTLTKLNISVYSIDSCLSLLDGRLKCLSTLIIKITAGVDRFSTRPNQEKLPQLKCFSLSLEGWTIHYDRLIVPLLGRMSNLEELTLFLTVSRRDSSFIDGKQLHNSVLKSMTRLQKLSFSIHTQLNNKDTEIKLPSGNELRNSFFELGYKDVDAFSHVTFVNNRADAHIYSLPYGFKHFYLLINSFQGGKFDQVRKLVMFDQRPFEHRLFQLIARDFPLLEILYVSNDEEQQVKDHSDEYIRFTHLSLLSLQNSHIDYAREFLCNEYISLPCLTNLVVKYQTLATVTNNFTHNQARRICNRITFFLPLEPFVRPKNFSLYFPLL